MHRIPLVLSIVIAGAAGAAAQDLTALRSFFGFADPHALAVSADETRAYAAEGASVAILDISSPAAPLPPSAILARIPVDASIISLLVDGTDLFIAGGSFGLLRLDLAQPGFPVSVIDDAGEKVCFETARMGSFLLAVFGAINASELRVYDRATLTLVTTVALGAGTACALVVDGTFAYLAMGTGGLARVDLASVLAPVVQPGPVFPVSVFAEPGRARDVALSGTRLYAAVDAIGLVSLRTTLPWGPLAVWTAVPLSGPSTPGTATLYAHHVAALGTTVAVGANRVAVAEADGGPFTSYGRMDYKLAVGGVTTPAPLANTDALMLFQQGATGLTLLNRSDIDGSWRELILRPGRVYEQHMVLGFVARSVAALPPVTVATHKGTGNAPAEVTLSLRDPDVVFSGQDGAGTIWSGLLDISDPDAIQPVPGTASLPSLGLWFDAQWPDAAPTREWFVGNGNDVWRLHRFDTANPSQGDFWEVLSPDDPEPGFNNGRNYFLSQLDGDLLLLTRGGTKWGLVGYSKAALVANAAVRPPGSLLNVAPLFQVATHVAGEAANGLSWRCKVHVTPAGQHVAVVCANFNTDALSPDFEHPQVMLYDVTAWVAALPSPVPPVLPPPPLIARIVAPNAQGAAVGLDLRSIGGVPYLLVADFAFGMHVYDLSNPAAPVRVGAWASPPNVIDGYPDHPADVETDFDPASGKTYAYLAVFRKGLVRIDVSQPTNLNLAIDAAADTPGLPYGIKIRHASGDKGLLLADHQAGLRLYGGFNRPPVASIAPVTGTYPSAQPATLVFTVSDPDGLQDLAFASLILNGGQDILPLILPALSVTLIPDGLQAALPPLLFPAGLAFQLDLTAADTHGATGSATSVLTFQ